MANIGVFRSLMLNDPNFPQKAANRIILKIAQVAEICFLTDQWVHRVWSQVKDLAAFDIPVVHYYRALLSHPRNLTNT